MRRQPCTGARWRDSPRDVARRTLRRDTDPRLALPSRERPLVFSTERPALTRPWWRLSQITSARSWYSSWPSTAAVSFLGGALRQLRWLRACPTKTNTNARSRIDQRSRCDARRRLRARQMVQSDPLSRRRSRSRGGPGGRSRPGRRCRRSRTAEAEPPRVGCRSRPRPLPFHIDAMQLVQRLAPVAVAVVMVCAVLAASRGCARWRGGLRRCSGRPGPGSARRSSGLYATTPN